MQTFNSFNELAAGQAALASDISVFNATPKELDKYMAVKPVWDIIGFVLLMIISLFI